MQTDGNATEGRVLRIAVIISAGAALTWLAVTFSGHSDMPADPLQAIGATP